MKTSQYTLRRAKNDIQSDAWSKLVPIYTPFINGWLHQCGIVDSDTPDLTQDVLIALIKKLPEFNHNGRTGAFRSWLKAITINHCRRYWEKKQKTVPGANCEAANVVIEQLADASSDLSSRWDREHDQEVLSGVIRMIQGEFDQATMTAFRRVAIQGEAAKDIAADLGVSIGQVYKFKFRVMRRLQEEAQGLIDSTDDMLRSA